MAIQKIENELSVPLIWVHTKIFSIYWNLTLEMKGGVYHISTKYFVSSELIAKEFTIPVYGKIIK